MPLTIPDMTLASKVEVPDSMKSLSDVASTATGIQNFRAGQADLAEKTRLRDFLTNDSQAYDQNGDLNAPYVQKKVMQLAPTQGGAALSTMLGNQTKKREVAEQQNVASALSNPSVLAAISHPKTIPNPADPEGPEIDNPHPMAGQVDPAKMSSLLTRLAPITGPAMMERYVANQQAQTNAQKSLVEMGAQKRSQMGQLAQSMIGRPIAEILKNTEAFKKANPDLADTVDYAVGHLKGLTDQTSIDKALQGFSQSTQEVGSQIAEKMPKGVQVSTGQTTKVVDTNPLSPTAGGTLSGTEAQMELPPTTPTVNDQGTPGYVGPTGNTAQPEQPTAPAPAATAPPEPRAASLGGVKPTTVGGKVQGGNADRLAIYQQELEQEKDPANRAAIQREIARLGPVTAPAAPAPSGAVQQLNDQFNAKKNKPGFVASGMAPLNPVQTVQADWKKTSDAASTATSNSSILNNIEHYATQFDKTGPGFDSRKAGVKIAQLFGIASDKALSADMLTKNAAFLALNGGNTDAARSMAEAIFPGGEMSLPGIKAAVSQLKSNNEMALDKARLFNRFTNSGDSTGYANALAKWNSAADPKIWEIRNMPAAERKAYLAKMPDDQKKALQRKSHILDSLGVNYAD